MPVLASLPDADYQFAEWLLARVSLDYHVEVDGFFYSVPHGLIGSGPTFASHAENAWLARPVRTAAAHGGCFTFGSGWALLVVVDRPE